MRSCRFLFVIVGAVLFGVAPAMADVPPVLNFQGILLNPGGGTVVDSTYDLTFRIYDDSIGGATTWSENQTVVTENGLFNTFLGRTFPVPGSTFDGPDRWLEIDLFGVGPYFPRTRISTVGYAFRVESVEGALGGHIEGTVHIHGGVDVGDLAGTPGSLTIADGSDVTIAADGPDGVVAILGTSETIFDMSKSGDISVSLPSNAVAASEILNEAGIAANRNPSVVTLPQGTTTMTDLATVTITIPTDGYITVQGRSVFTVGGPAGRNLVYLQIDEGAGGAEDAAHLSEAGLDAHSNSGTHRLIQTVYADRVYFMAAGTYTFRLEARAIEDNSSGAISELRNSSITASFFPTSYGTVTTLTTASGAAQFQSATPVTVDVTGTPETYYQVDLRELEIRAAEARTEYERLMNELIKARFRR